VSSHDRAHYEPMGLPVIASKRDFDMKRVNWMELGKLKELVQAQFHDAAQMCGVPNMASCLKQQPGPTRTKPLTGP